MRIRFAPTFLAVGVACWLSACAESSVLPPAGPSPLPEEKIGRLTLACPADVRTQSFDGRPVTVAFELPMAVGGQAPVDVGCTPESGHAFGIGATEVSCSASDVLQQAASCTFRVGVLGPPKLAATRFLAFGDSMTAGVVSSPNGPGNLDPSRSYVTVLERGLQGSYVTQQISVLNAGAPGEEARHAVSRFESVLRTHRPEVVLLMEGANDLDAVGGGGADPGAQAIDSMVNRAQGAGLDVLLMTIPPQRFTAQASAVPGFNDRIRAIAARRGVVLVDIYNVLASGACPGSRMFPCIGADGLHPTADGYRLMAEELARVIVERYDVEITLASPGPSQGDSLVGAPAERQ